MVDEDLILRIEDSDVDSKSCEPENSAVAMRQYSSRIRCFRLAVHMLHNLDIPAGLVGRKPCFDNPDFILYVNPKFLSDLGYRKEEVVGEQYWKFIEGDPQSIQNMLSGKPIKKRPVIVKRKDGSSVQYSLTKRDYYEPSFGKRKVYNLTYFYLSQM